MKLAEIPTPALVVDLAIVQQNIDRLASYASKHRLNVRPHTKTHKNREMATMQLAAGAIGLTMAKVGETEVLADLCDDLLIAYPMVDGPRVQRIAELARTRTIRVAVDSIFAADAIATAARSAKSTVGLLVEIDVGMGRVGVATPSDALKLAEHISSLQGVRLDGLMCYPGQIWAAADEQAAALGWVAEKLHETLDLWKQNGLQAKIVSGGSTPTAYQSHLVPQYTEIRPGTYIFNDVNEWRGGFAAFDDCAARIIATVVSDAVPNQVVIDGGTKTFTSDLCHPAKESGHGFMVEYPLAKIVRLSEEHGQVDVSTLEQRPKVGERVSVIPNHICPCVNLQDRIWLLESDGNVSPICVDGRGKLS
ncbi:MAG: alanine racemase [Pirellulaceae bacterium]|nr:alanine racemase [Pirellulaceae bacterium]